MLRRACVPRANASVDRAVCNFEREAAQTIASVADEGYLVGNDFECKALLVTTTSRAKTLWNDTECKALLVATTLRVKMCFGHFLEWLWNSGDKQLHWRQDGHLQSFYPPTIRTHRYLFVPC